MKTILCPTDFSASAKNAAVYATNLAKEFNSLVILIHVYESPLLYADEPLVTVAELNKSIKDAAEKNILKLKSQLLEVGKDLRIDTILKEGDGPDEITKYADKIHSDLIVIGASGKGNAERMLIGSTTSKVISKAHCPVLSIPKKQPYNGINKIVYATDLEEDNLNAALEIVTIAKKFSSEIVFVYIDGTQLVHSDEKISGMTKKIRSHIRYNKISGYIAKNIHVTEGLEYFLKKNPADMLVMFTHQRHFPVSLTKPSITRKMSNRIKIPMLALMVPDRTVAGVL